MATVSRLRRLTRRVPKRQAGTNSDPTITKLLSKSVIKPHIQKTYENVMRRPVNDASLKTLAYEPPQSLHSLLPLLAKGFGRRRTRSKGLLCSFYALEGSLKAVQDLVGNPNTLTFDDIHALWKSDRFKALRDQAIREQPWDWTTSNIIYKERVKGLNNEDFLSQEELTILLGLINEDLKTNYQLGIISTSPDQKLPSATMLSGQDPSMPVLWIQNNDSEHWEIFAPINALNPMPDSYLLADQIERAIQNGVYLVLNSVTTNLDGNLAASQGEFLHEIDWPVGEPVREGWVSVINSGNGFGLIELKNLEKIERIAKTPRIPVDMDVDPRGLYESTPERFIEKPKRSTPPTQSEGQPKEPAPEWVIEKPKRSAPPTQPEGQPKSKKPKRGVGQRPTSAKARTGIPTSAQGSTPFAAPGGSVVLPTPVTLSGQNIDMLQGSPTQAPIAPEGPALLQEPVLLPNSGPIPRGNRRLIMRQYMQPKELQAVNRATKKLKDVKKRFGIESGVGHGEWVREVASNKIVTWREGPKVDRATFSEVIREDGQVCYVRSGDLAPEINNPWGLNSVQGIVDVDDPYFYPGNINASFKGICADRKLDTKGLYIIQKWRVRHYDIDAEMKSGAIVPLMMYRKFTASKEGVRSVSGTLNQLPKGTVMRVADGKQWTPFTGIRFLLTIRADQEQLSRSHFEELRAPWGITLSKDQAVELDKLRLEAGSQDVENDADDQGDVVGEIANLPPKPTPKKKQSGKEKDRGNGKRKLATLKSPPVTTSTRNPINTLDTTELKAAALVETYLTDSDNLLAINGSKRISVISVPQARLRNRLLRALGNLEKQLGSPVKSPRLSPEGRDILVRILCGSKDLKSRLSLFSVTSAGPKKPLCTMDACYWAADCAARARVPKSSFTSPSPKPELTSEDDNAKGDTVHHGKRKPTDRGDEGNEDTTPNNKKPKIEESTMNANRREPVGPFPAPLNKVAEIKVKQAEKEMQQDTMTPVPNLDRFYLTASDFRTLFGSQASLNDEILNSYLQYVANEANTRANRLLIESRIPSVLLHNSFFYKTLVSPDGLRRVSRWTRNKGAGGQHLLQVDLVLIPVHQHDHWTLIVISPKQRTIEYFDSMGGCPAECIKNIHLWLAQELEEAYVASQWTFLNTLVPLQTDSDSCGVCVAMNAECVVAGLTTTAYDPNNMLACRNRIAAVLLYGGFDKSAGLVFGDEQQEIKEEDSA